MKKCDIINIIAYFILALALLAAMYRATEKWTENKPEWMYYKQLTESPLSDVMGADKAIFGYLPGFKAMLIPFVRTEPIGFFILLSANAISCIGALTIMYRHIRARDCEKVSILWLSCCAAIPMWFAVQNNQLVAPAVFLLLLALREMWKEHDFNAGLLITIATLVKTLPIPLLAFPFLRKQWKTVFTAVLAIPLLSFALTVASDGVSASIDGHIAWPEQVVTQSPHKIIFHDLEPESFSRNQSFQAEMVRLARYLEAEELILIAPALVFSTLTALAMVSLLRIRRKDHFWHCAAAWMTWLAFAAPFGRYYYLLLTVPSLYVLGLSTFRLQSKMRHILFYILIPASISMLAARSSNPIYAVVTTAILIAHLIIIVKLYIVNRTFPGSVRLRPQARKES